MASIPLYRAADLRRVERAAADQPLMQRAGRAAADLASALCGDRGSSVLVLAGPGNNGGDAFEAARLLKERYFDTHVVFSGQLEHLPVDAAKALKRFVAAGGRTLTTIPATARWSLIIDGLFGIGLGREISGPYAELIHSANALAERDDCSLIALDCPSGLDADTGRRLGPTIRATHTITFIGGKPGLLTADGPDSSGIVSVAPLGLAPPEPGASSGRTIDLDLFSAHLKKRPRNSHKGSYGNAGILGGASGMTGAAMLAARAALRLGSGRVYACLLAANAPALDLLQPELMFRSADEVLSIGLTALGCGPGLGQSDEACGLLEKACALDLPLVLDADALNLLAGEDRILAALARRAAPALLTPHPAEAARLLGCTTSAIQADRIAAALELAARYRALVALKGCGTVVASPDGCWFINTSGNAGMAAAGSGDVLTGIVTALLAQGWPPLEALLAAVHLHGAAADSLVDQGKGPVGLTAGEVIDGARSCLNRWISETQAR